MRILLYQATASRAASGETRWELLARDVRVCVEGTANLVAAARAAGARRIVAQSIAFATAPVGPDPRDESAPLYLDAPDHGGPGR
jgi:nucleoside-diphosphate-sugar epimerase